MTLQASEANIMVVDDTPANIRLLEVVWAAPSPLRCRGVKREM